MDSIALLQTRLAAAFGPSGRESGVRELISTVARDFADEIRTDNLGNLIVRKKGDGKKIMLCAHMDSLGLIVTHIEENGFLRFSNIGGINPHRLIDSAIVFENGTRGIVGYEAGAVFKELKMHNLYIDIGADSSEIARKSVEVGDVAVYRDETFEQNGKLFSNYLDDRIGCVVLLKVLDGLKSCNNDLYFTFSVQEELGLRGAGAAAYGIMPDYCIAVDVTTSGDTPEFKPMLNQRVGGGAAIKIADNSVICHPKAVEWLESAGSGLKTQREVLVRGGTDTAAIQRTGTGCIAGAISIPTRYIHGTAELASIDDIQCCIDLIKIAVQADLV